MKRSLGFVAGAALAACIASGTARAQRVDASSLPAVPPRDAGTLDWATGQWHPPSSERPDQPGPSLGVTIYDNTCTWTGGLRFAATESCWERYDDGRIPSPSSPGAPPGAAPCNLVTNFTLGYCTSEAPGNVRVQVGIYEGLEASGIGGLCPGGQAPSGAGLPKPPLNLFGPRDIFVDLSNAGLPADPTGGGQLACWTVTVDLSNNLAGGMPFFSDGDGAFDGQAHFDRFTWVWSQDGTTEVFGPTGPLLAAEPNFAAPGQGTFGIPPGFDPIAGVPCGTGLGDVDLFWINADGAPVGSPGGTCAPLLAMGSSCYLAGPGGWPSSPWAGLYLRMQRGAGLGGSVCAQVASVSFYCTPKISTIGCIPDIGADGNPSVSFGHFLITASQIMNFKNGMLFYGINGPANIPLLNGDILCVQPPLKRTPATNSGGNPPPVSDCSGTFAFDFLQWFTSGQDPNLGLGVPINCQWWYRDPGAPGPMSASGRGMTNAAMFHWSP